MLSLRYEGHSKIEASKKKFIVIRNILVKPTLPLNVFCNLYDFVIV